MLYLPVKALLVRVLVGPGPPPDPGLQNAVPQAAPLVAGSLLEHVATPHSTCKQSLLPFFG